MEVTLYVAALPTVSTGAGVAYAIAGRATTALKVRLVALVPLALVAVMVSAVEDIGAVGPVVLTAQVVLLRL